MGVAFAFLALICWGFGDFLIQRSARKFGDWVALFYVTAFATVFLFPFIWHDIPELLSRERLPLILWFSSLVLLLAALLDFEALRIGKISVVEPIYALEVPITVILGTFVLQEFLNPIQSVLIVTLIIGIILVATKSLHHLKGIHAERGVWYAIFATIGMGATNFLFGVGARETSPLIINWFTSAFIACFAFGYLLAHGRLGEISTGWRFAPQTHHGREHHR